MPYLKNAKTARKTSCGLLLFGDNRVMRFALFYVKQKGASIKVNAPKNALSLVVAKQTKYQKAKQANENKTSIFTK